MAKLWRHGLRDLERHRVPRWVAGEPQPASDARSPYK